MKATRVGSFDDKMFYKLAESIAVNAMSKAMSNLSEKVNGARIEMEDFKKTIYECREKQIGDSHSLDSNFGYE